MWNPKTQRYDISLNGWAGWIAYGDWKWWAGKVVTADSMDLIYKMRELYKWLVSNPAWTRAQMMIGKGDMWVYYKYIQKNLMYKKYQDARASGVTFGSTTEGEWKALQAAASSIDWSSSNATLWREINRLIVDHLKWDPLDLSGWVTPAPAATTKTTKTTKPTTPAPTKPKIILWDKTKSRLQK